MTLLELLLKELPKRGGWPEGANFIACDEDGEVDSYEFTPVLGRSGIDWRCSGGRGYLGHKIVPECTCSDWETSIITREQYEAAQQRVWNGEGLPPVGCDVEYETIKDNWRKCRVMYLGEKCNIVRTDEWGEVSCGLSVKFRPIRTEAERKREEAIEAIRLATAGADQDKPFNEAIYDAIVAGKIPGVYIK